MSELYGFLAIAIGTFFAFRFHLQSRGWGWGCLYGVLLMPVALAHALIIVVTTFLALRALGAAPIHALIITITTSLTLETSIRTTWAVLTKESHGANQYLQRASKYIDQGRYDDAIDNVDRAIDLDPGNVPAYAARSSHFKLRSQYDKAIVDLNSAIALDPGDASLYVQRGSAWIGLREFGRAIEDLNAAISLKPDAEAFMARGEAHTGIGEYASAIEDYEHAVTLSPGTDAYTARGSTYFKLNDYDNAIDDFNRATALDKTNPDAFMSRGNVYLARRNFHTAIEEFTQAISLVPDVVDSYSDELELLDSDTELAQYERIIESLGAMYCNRGFCYLGIGETDKAIQDFDAAIKLQPENADFYCARSTAHVQAAKHADGIRDLDMALQLDSTNINALFLRAVLSFNREHFHKAVEDSSRAIALDSRRSDFYCVRGRSQLHLGDYNSAIADLDKAIESESKNGLPLKLELKLDRPFAYACRGLSHLLLGNNTIARRDLGKALTLGYEQGEIEEEIAELMPDKKDRKPYLDLVRSIEPDKGPRVSRKEQESVSMEPTSDRFRDSHKVGATPGIEQLNTLDREEYTILFRKLGFYAIETGKTLKHRKPMPSIYFNCRYGKVSFVVYKKDEHRYPPDLWNQVPPQKMKDAKHNLMTVVPKVGREQDAFEQLLI